MSGYVRDVVGAVRDLGENRYWRHSPDSHERSEAAGERAAFWAEFWAAVLGNGPRMCDDRVGDGRTDGRGAADC